MKKEEDPYQHQRHFRHGRRFARNRRYFHSQQQSSSPGWNPRFLQSAKNAHTPLKNKTREGSQAVTIVKNISDPDCSPPVHTDPIGTTKICQFKLLLTCLSTINGLTSWFPLHGNERNTRICNFFHLRQYAFMKNSLTQLIQQKSPFVQSQHTNASFLTKSLCRSCTQSYASSIPGPNSAL